MVSATIPNLHEILHQKYYIAWHYAVIILPEIALLYQVHREEEKKRFFG